MERIDSSNNEAWSEYHEIQRNRPPSALLLKALPFVVNTDYALDLGAGSLRNSLYLLNHGFRNVVAVEKSSIINKYKNIPTTGHLEIINLSFEDFNFEESKYDLINAQSSLPFIEPSNFSNVLDKIKKSLKVKGIFTGNFFGINDGWKTDGTKLTFLDESDVKGLFSGLDIIDFSENEFDGKTVTGIPKHWHVFNVIAQK